ncbi:MAG TPA: DUF72 domain-containing protein [Pseudonocardiaceae bacterium]|nr:DUF72 domain-containing protein [Pseudonocardiaceae bacterium]
MGTSGWAYPEWRGSFYPTGLPQRRHLEYLAGQFSTVEINGSFYSLQRPSSYQNWSAQTPSDFCLAVKGGRFITHLRRLREPEVPLANFFASGVLALGDKLGPVLWQFPANLPFDPDLLAEFIAFLPRGTKDAAELANRHGPVLTADRTWLTVDEDRPLRHAIEVRHESFRTEVFSDLLRANDIALVVSDSPGTWPCFEEITANFSYFRLHGHTELYASGYSRRALADWAAKIRDWSKQGDVYVYFDNTAKGHAPRDADRLAALLDLDRQVSECAAGGP